MLGSWGGAGFEVERLDKPQATEAELCEAVKGKVGYILGGIEKVTDKVVESADELKAIVFAGADWAGFIPGYKKAKQKGIVIANAPGANSYAVAEYTISLMAAMVRRIFELGSTGQSTFVTTTSLADSTVGVIGMGQIGTRVAGMLKGLGTQKILYWNRHRKPELEKELDIEFVELEELFKRSQIVTVHVSSAVGPGFIGADLLAKLPDDSLLINTGYEAMYDMGALYKELSNGRLRAAFDERPQEQFRKLPLSQWFSSNENAGYNTFQANKLASDMATESIINLLKTGTDQYLVNPEYKHRKN